MISLNLVPQVKADFLRAQRMKRFIMLISFLISAGMVALVVFLSVFVYVVQERQSSGLQEDIATNLSELQNINNLERVVTVKNQLDSLPQLHEEKPISSRMFDFLTVLIPEEATLSSIELRFGETDEFGDEFFDDSTTGDGIETFARGGSFTFLGSAESFRDVNVLADSLKLAGYTLEDNGESLIAFDDVVTEGLDKDNDEGVFFSIRGDFSQDLFDFNNDDLLLTVPNVTSTASSRTDLFQGGEVPEELQSQTEEGL